jgi:signal transduction histidine kinase
MSVFERFGQWAEENPHRLDSTAAIFALVLVFPYTLFTHQNREWFFGNDPSGIWSAMFAFFLIAPLVLRRSAPLLSAALVFTAALLHMLLGPYIIFPADLTVAVSLYSLTVYGSLWSGRIALLMSFAGAVVFGLRAYPAHAFPTRLVVATALTLSLLFLTTWAFAHMRRARIESLRALREKNQALEVEREQQIKLGAAIERARIAREMHDIVAHSLSVMIAQADGGRYAAQLNPEFAQTALGTIAETGRAALADMRRLLGVLRENDSNTEANILTPQPGTENIDALVNQIRMSGVRVSLVRMGTPRTLPPGAGLTLYRICQESLTNILKHAGHDPTVTVVLTWHRSHVMLEVEDDGRGAAAAASSDGAGMGLIGMKERAALFGGSVKAGPKPGGGYRVELELPLHHQATDSDA